MRKFIIALLMVALVVVLAACNNNRTDDDDNVNDAPPTTTAPVEGGGETGPAFPTQPVDRPIGSRAEILASIPTGVVPSGSLNVADGTQATINMLYGWDNVAVNARARRLMWENNSTMDSNMDREMFPNPMVNSAPIQSVDNPDGSRTHTFTIYTDNRWSDGRNITAHDYVGWILLTANPYMLDLQVSPAGSFWMQGRQAYARGEAPTITGVRIYSETQFSVTVYAEFLPYTWEAFIHMSHMPMPLHAMIPGFDTQTQVRDSENGAYLYGITPELLSAGIDGTLTEDEEGNLVGGDGFRFNPTVTSGPYRFVSYDPSTFMIILEANPYFSGTWDGFVPRIQTLIFSRHTAAVVVDALAAGEADMVTGQGGGETINNMFEFLVGAGTHEAVPYTRNGFGFLRFHVDHGPTQFREVRQAFKWLVDRDEFAEMFTLGHGVVNHGPYGTAQWFAVDAVARGMYDQLIMYTYNPTRAIEILEAGGWTLNAQGEPFVLGVDSVRYRDIAGHQQHPHDLPFADDPMVFNIGGRQLMRLEIHWATWNAEDNRITEIFEVLVPAELEAVGFNLVTHRLSNPLAHLTRSEDPNPTFHLFNQGVTFDPRVWRPWTLVNPDYRGSNNLTWTSDPAPFEVAERMSRIEIQTPAGRNAFVDAFIELMIILNYEVHEIPLYVDIWYDFIPTWLGNWHNNSVWGMDHAVIRAYVRN